MQQRATFAGWARAPQTQTGVGGGPEGDAAGRWAGGRGAQPRAPAPRSLRRPPSLRVGARGQAEDEGPRAGTGACPRDRPARRLPPAEPPPPPPAAAPGVPRTRRPPARPPAAPSLLPPPPPPRAAQPEPPPQSQPRALWHLELQ
ncbi:cofilin-2 isoform X2 [Dipodomys merriami]|uniref:cofilin-2 isoform X2 n=1 Tax=Dipodomys merriami TaxID=94247 RepID=UPI00384EF0FA